AITQHTHPIFHTQAFAPGSHHKRIVDGNAPDLVDSLGLEIVCCLKITRKMLLGASRGKGARHRKQRHGFSFGLLSNLEWIRTQTASLGFHLDVFSECSVRDWVSFFDRHGVLLVSMGKSRNSSGEPILFVA